MQHCAWAQQNEAVDIFVFQLCLRLNQRLLQSHSTLIGTRKALQALQALWLSGPSCALDALAKFFGSKFDNFD